MHDNLLFNRQATKDMKSLDRALVRRILEKIELLRHDLQGDVKHLTNFTPSHRLRVGEYRVLFEIERDTVVIHRVAHRRNAYRRRGPA